MLTDETPKYTITEAMLILVKYRKWREMILSRIKNRLNRPDVIWCEKHKRFEQW